ncbi:MAG: sulfotransferase, partial [Alphaproteobacteria bacterium]|nr:sulfotransferase [Alphaproteobacteria bacterium]
KKIVWRKTGPWISQHDIDLLEDGTYSVFNNNNLQLMMRESGEELKPGVVGINIYDPQSGEVVSPYDSILQGINLRVETEGLCRILPNGDVFLESPNEGALYRLSPDSVRWRYENLFEDAERVGVLGWSRYLHEDEVNPGIFSESSVDALVEYVPVKTKSSDVSILFIVCFSAAIGVMGGEIMRRFVRAQLLSKVWQPIRLSLAAVKNRELCDAQKQQMLLQYSREILIVCGKVMGFLVVLVIAVIGCTALFSIWDSQSYRQLYSIKVILISSIVAAVWCGLRNRLPTTDYGFWSRLLHMLALRFTVAGRVTLDVNDLFAANRGSAVRDQEGHIFVSGLARSGTTLLMRCLYDSDKFCSLTYEDMPFVLAPAVWRRVRPRVHAGNTLRERAHGDGIMVDAKSPEAFEEVFWRIRCSNRYLLADRLVPMTASTEEIESFRKYVDSIITSDCLLRNQQNTRRYLSKNNNNILRMPSIADAFPRAIQLVPFRDPVQHANSLMTQHKRFLKINQDDPFTKKYMEWLGHYEFGSAHRPFRFDTKLEQMGTTTSPEYWLQMWNDVYRALINSHSHNTLFFDYDAFCVNPLPIWSSLCEKLDIPVACGLGNIRSPNVAKASGDIHVSSTLLREVQATYQQMKDMAVKAAGLRRSG